MKYSLEKIEDDCARIEVTRGKVKEFSLRVTSMRRVGHAEVAVYIGANEHPVATLLVPIKEPDFGDYS